jgi:hypothetical protein
LASWIESDVEIIRVGFAAARMSETSFVFVSGSVAFRDGALVSSISGPSSLSESFVRFIAASMSLTMCIPEWGKRAVFECTPVFPFSGKLEVFFVV